jgi:hypothetical protein
MNVYEWIFTLVLNYFISLATLISAVVFSLKFIQEPMLFATQDNL